MHNTKDVDVLNGLIRDKARQAHTAMRVLGVDSPLCIQRLKELAYAQALARAERTYYI